MKKFPIILFLITLLFSILLWESSQFLRTRDLFPRLRKWMGLPKEMVSSTWKRPIL